MTSQYRHRRSSNPATPFPTLEPGEIAVNTANRQLAVGDTAAGLVGTPVPLLAVRIFDTDAIYAVGDLVVNAASVYRAKAVTGPGVFDPTKWDLSAAQLLISDTPPASAQDGTFWWESDTGLLYVRNAGAWVTVVAIDGTKVLKAGDTMTGALTIQAGTSVPMLTLKSTVDNKTKTLSMSPGGVLQILNDAQNANLFSVNDVGAGYLANALIVGNAGLTGSVFFGNAGTKYLQYDGTNYNLVGGNLLIPGDVVITKPTAALTLNKTDPLTGNQVQGKTNGVFRWKLNLGGGGAESGSNAGADFSLIACDDSGANLNFAMTIPRATGLLSLIGDPTAALGAATRQYVDAAGVGQCFLSLVNATTVKLSRCKGAYLTINNRRELIPAAGVSYTGFSNSTFYYIYAFMTGSVMTLAADATPPVYDPTSGVKVKTGSANLTLVGMVYSGVSGIVDTNQTRWVRSWFNDKGIVANFSSTNISSSSTVPINSGATINLLLWSGERISLSGALTATVTAGGPTAFGVNLYNASTPASLGGGTQLVHQATNGYSSPAFATATDQFAADGLVSYALYWFAYSGTWTLQVPVIAGHTTGSGQ